MKREVWYYHSQLSLLQRKLLVSVNIGRNGQIQGATSEISDNGTAVAVNLEVNNGWQFG